MLIPRILQTLFIGIIMIIPTSIFGNAENNNEYPANIIDDFDSDGLNNTLEKELGTNFRLWDSDGDGLSDGDEYYIYKTDPTKLSTDGDLYDDGMEILGYSPNGDMPNYVKKPGNDPFVAAFPDISFEVSDDIDIVIKEDITDIEGKNVGKINATTETVNTIQYDGYMTYLTDEMFGFSNNFNQYLNTDNMNNIDDRDVDLFNNNYISGQLTSLGVSKRKEISDSDTFSYFVDSTITTNDCNNKYDEADELKTWDNNIAPIMNDTDRDGISDYEERILSERYYPYMYFHENEIFFPTAIDFPLEHSDLYEYKPINEKLIDGPISVDDLLEYGDEKSCLQYDYGVMEDNKLDFFYEKYYKYSPDYTSNYKYDYSIYSRVTPVWYDFNNDGNLQQYRIIQYWYYYVYDYLPFNPVKGEFGNRHEGDWEMVMYVFDPQNNPLFGYYSQHYWGEIKRWEDIEKVNGHPKVYVANGSHASYYTSDLDGHEIYEYIDFCGTDEIRYKRKPDIILIEDNDRYSEENEWFSYPGLWGKTGPPLFSGGPGPRYQVKKDLYLIGEKINRWQQPLRFIDDDLLTFANNIPSEIEKWNYHESVGLIDEIATDGNNDQCDVGKIINKDSNVYHVTSVMDSNNYHGPGNEMSFNVQTQKENFHSIQSTETNIVATSEFWMKAKTSRVHDAAELRFLFTIENSGTDVARTVEGIRFEIEIGNDTRPITYPPLYENLKISNLFPGETHTLSVNPGISITYDQLKLIDNGAKINITLKDFSFDEDELYYENAYEQSVIFEVNYGESFDEQTVHTYMCYIGENYTYLDSLNHALPIDLVNNTLYSIGNYEINDHSWWNVFNTRVYNGSFIFALAEPKQKVHLRYYQDSDRDGYTDQMEYDMGYDMNNYHSHPSPLIIGNITYDMENNDRYGVLTLNNAGDYKATNVESIIFSPDQSTTILDGFTGGGGTLESNQTYTIDDDKFHFETNSPFYKEPIMVVKYNDPNRNHITLFNNSLNSSTYFDFTGVDFQSPYLCSYTKDNEIVAVINNPTEGNWTDMRLHLNIFNLGGELLKSYQKNISVFPGDNQYWFSWKPSDIIQNNESNMEHKYQIVFTDHNELIVDTEVNYFIPITDQYSGETGSCQLYPENWDFGNRTLNETFEREFSIINTGLGNLEFFLDFSENISSNDIDFKNGGVSVLYTLEPAESLDFMVEGNSSKIGDYQEYIRVLSSDPQDYIKSFQIKFSIGGNQSVDIQELDYNVKINLSSVTVTPEYPSNNQQTEIRYEIINEGQFPVFILNVSVNNGSYKNVLSELSRNEISVIDEMSSYQGNISFKYSGQSRIVLFIDCDEKYQEWNEFDNFYECDINLNNFTGTSLTGTNAAIMKDNSYTLSSNIQLQGNSQLVIENSTVSSTKDIIIEDNSTLLIKNSNVTFQHIRVKNSGILLLHNSLVYLDNINWGGDTINVSFSHIYIQRSNGATGLSGSLPGTGGSPDEIYFINNATEITYLHSNFTLIGGNGGVGGASTSSTVIGGTGGKGSSIFFYCYSDNITDISNNFIMSTGSGGAGGRGVPGGVGGKSGSFVFKEVIENTALLKDTKYDIKINNGGDGFDGSSDPWKRGGAGGSSGKILFELNSIDLILNGSEIKIRGGSGGEGGNGHPTPAVNGYDYRGGNGGAGGYAEEFISYINGTKTSITQSIIDFRLGNKAGDGGSGGTSNWGDGGNGGSGGSSGVSKLFFHSNSSLFYRSEIFLGGIDGGSGGAGGSGDYGESVSRSAGHGGNGGSANNCSITIIGNIITMNATLINTEGPDGGDGNVGGKGSLNGGNGGFGGNTDNTCILIHCSELNIKNSTYRNIGDSAGDGGDGTRTTGHGNYGGDAGYSIIEIISNQVTSSRCNYYNMGAKGGSGGDGAYGWDDNNGGNGGNSGEGGPTFIIWEANKTRSDFDNFEVYGGQSRDAGDGGEGDSDPGGNGGYGDKGGYAKLIIESNMSIIDTQNVIVQAGKSGNGGDGGDSRSSSSGNAQSAGLARVGSAGSNSIIMIRGINATLNNLNYSCFGGLGGNGGNGGSGSPPTSGAGGGIGGDGVIKINLSNCLFDNNYVVVKGGSGGKGGNGGNSVSTTSGTSGSSGGKGGSAKFEINVSNDFNLSDRKNMLVSVGGIGGVGGSGGENKAGTVGGDGGDAMLSIVNFAQLDIENMVLNITGGIGGNGGGGDNPYTGGGGGDGGDSFYLIKATDLFFLGSDIYLNGGPGGTPGVSEVGSNSGTNGDDGTTRFVFNIDMFNSTNTTFNHPLEIKYGTSTLINTTAPSITVSTGSYLKEYHWIKFIVENEYDNPILDAMITIVDNSSLEICEDAQPVNGVFEIALLNEVISNTSSISYIYTVNTKVVVGDDIHKSAEKTVVANLNQIIKITISNIYPDLYVDGLNFDKINYQAGEEVGISVEIGNSGDFSCLEAEIEILEISNDPCEIFKGKVFNIQKNETIIMNLTWISRSEKNTIKVIIDPDNKVSEMNEENNIFFAGPRILMGSVNQEPSSVIQGDIVEIQFNVTNGGHLYLPNSIITMSVEEELNSVLYSTNPLNGTHSFSFNLNTSELYGWIQVTVDFDPHDIYFKVNTPMVGSINIYVDKDSDGDGIPNLADIDIDNDGYNNSDDAFPEDPNEWLDTDHDGIGNNVDDDDDGDGYPDDVDPFPLDPSEWVDTDGDGIGDNTDDDDDNDGVLDIDDYYPKNPALWEDPDSNKLDAISSDIERMNETLALIMEWLETIDSNVQDIDSNVRYLNNSLAGLNHSFSNEFAMIKLQLLDLEKQIQNSLNDMNSSLMISLEGMNSSLRKYFHEQCMSLQSQLIGVNTSIHGHLDVMYVGINRSMKDIDVPILDRLNELSHQIEGINRSIGDRIDFDVDSLKGEVLNAIKDLENKTSEMNNSLHGEIALLNASIKNKIDDEISRLDISIRDYLSGLEDNISIDFSESLEDINTSILQGLQNLDQHLDEINRSIGEKIDYNISMLKSQVLEAITILEIETSAMNRSLHNETIRLETSIKNKIDSEMIFFDMSIREYFNDLEMNISYDMDSMNKSMQKNDLDILNFIQSSTDILESSLELLNISLTYQLSEYSSNQIEYNGQMTNLLNDSINQLEDYYNQTTQGQVIIREDINNLQEHLDNVGIDLDDIQEDLIMANIHLLTYLNNDTVFEFINDTQSRIENISIQESLINRNLENISEILRSLEDINNATADLDEMYESLLNMDEEMEDRDSSNKRISVSILIISVIITIISCLLLYKNRNYFLDTIREQKWN